jgi:hypothetical protein
MSADDTLASVSKAAPDVLKHLGFGGAACVAWTVVVVFALWRGDWLLVRELWPWLYGTWLTLGFVWFVGYVIGLAVWRSVQQAQAENERLVRDASELSSDLARVQTQLATAKRERDEIDKRLVDLTQRLDAAKAEASAAAASSAARCALSPRPWPH